MELAINVVGAEVAELLRCLLTLIQIGLVAILSASFSLFFDYFQTSHPIGRWYAGMLSRLPEKFAKPLGECIYCAGTWIYLITVYLTINNYLWLCLIGVGINHLAISWLLSLSNRWSQKK